VEPLNGLACLVIHRNDLPLVTGALDPHQRALVDHAARAQYMHQGERKIVDIRADLRACLTASGRINPSEPGASGPRVARLGKCVTQSSTRAACVVGPNRSCVDFHIVPL
jgi:hypothetical protein